MSYNFPYKLVMKLKNPFIHGTLELKKKFYMMSACMTKDFTMHKIIIYIKNYNVKI